MSSVQVQEYRTRMAEVERRLLAELEELPREEMRFVTDQPRWNTVRRVLLRLGDHMREHTTQLVEAREAVGAAPTMPQRILAQAMQAYGCFLGATVGLTDEDLDRAPAPGEWSPRQVLDHLVENQASYLDLIRRAREARQPVERD